MRIITILAIIAILAGAVTTGAIGSSIATSVTAQMADNATMGNITNNMTSNKTDPTGSISKRIG